LVTVGPAWWEIGLRFADMSGMIPTGMDVRVANDTCVWAGQRAEGSYVEPSAEERAADQAAYAKLREAQMRWGGPTSQPDWATVAERTSTSWFLLRAPRSWITFDYGTHRWVEGQERRPCPRPTEYDLWTLDLDTPERVKTYKKGKQVNRFIRFLPPPPAAPQMEPPMADTETQAPEAEAPGTSGEVQRPALPPPPQAPPPAAPADVEMGDDDEDWTTGFPDAPDDDMGDGPPGGGPPEAEQGQGLGTTWSQLRCMFKHGGALRMAAARSKATGSRAVAICTTRACKTVT
jgi:hypothetical protein